MCAACYARVVRDDQDRRVVLTVQRLEDIQHSSPLTLSRLPIGLSARMIAGVNDMSGNVWAMILIYNFTTKARRHLVLLVSTCLVVFRQ
jgi:hypothetical protein